MNKFLAAVALTLIAGPALAASTTVEFKRDTGQVQVVTLDGAGGASLADGTALAYTYDEAAMKMCFIVEGMDPNCVVFAESVPDPKVGDSVRYTAADGAMGTATVTAITE
ncbi:MAG: hypothetical protein GC152_02230 [Alphaproteobacteria bacterium]|nr:hypothetical protein [Alphaproteobacteria bacterium]